MAAPDQSYGAGRAALFSGMTIVRCPDLLLEPLSFFASQAGVHVSPCVAVALRPSDTCTESRVYPMEVRG